MEFKEKFSELRRGHGLTREELAKKIGMSIEMILDIEEGKIIPNNSQIEKISNLFEVPQKLLIDNSLDIEDILDKLYLNEINTISYREQSNVKILNKKIYIIKWIEESYITE